MGSAEAPSPELAAGSTAVAAPVGDDAPPVPGPAGGLGVRVERVAVDVFTIPTDRPESDGTYAWTSTTIVVARAFAAGHAGLGYSYADPTAGALIVERLIRLVVGLDAADTSAAWSAMVAAVRNLGRPGIAATAISAVDMALWDLKSRLLGLPLADLLGRAHDRVAPYGSGGFTSYTDAELRSQLGGWADAGFRSVKLKVGRDPDADPHRVAVARDAVGPDVAVMVDANGALDRRSALATAVVFAEQRVTWFEEPVSSDDLEGLRWIRDRTPAAMAVAAGEYGWGPDAFRRLLIAGAVDVLQADATRCTGVTGFLLASALCEAFHVPLSAHCAPSIHLPLMAAARPGVNMEWFHDHVRIEHLLFDGAPTPANGWLVPDPSAPGFGLTLREADAAPYRVWSGA
jgi:L-alanine-DL-glutamate epimerase-like enolase superfamily enzyme